jgi:Bacteriophage baseplate protein W
MSETDLLIGKGWKFPIKVNAKGGLSYSAGAERIQDAIWIVLGTSQKERLLRMTFGGSAYEYVFEPNSNVMRTQLATAVREALVRWEPRIELVNVSVIQGTQPSEVRVSIDYRIRSTNELFNLVYPLYTEEGAG